MASQGEIRAAIAEKFTSVAGLRFDAFVPEAINPPAGFVDCISWNDETFDGSILYVFHAVILVARGASARIGQSTLDDLVTAGGPVASVIDDHDDLGLTDGTQAIISSGYQRLSVEEIAAYQYYGGYFEIQVTTTP